MPVPASSAVSSEPRDPQRIYSIAELAREFAITARTIRFYEDEGLIKPRRQGLTRLYSAGDRARLRKPYTNLLAHLQRVHALRRNRPMACSHDIQGTTSFRHLLRRDHFCLGLGRAIPARFHLYLALRFFTGKWTRGRQRSVKSNSTPRYLARKVPGFWLIWLV